MDLTIIPEKLEEHIKFCGICSSCNRPNTGREWCSNCNPDRLKETEGIIGNHEIGKLICEVQHKTRHFDDNLEWVPYDRFHDIKLVGEGGFAKIYSAIWNRENREPEINRRPTKVVLKKPKTSVQDFINEIKIHNECSYANFHITQIYGLTKNPVTGEFMMVLEYASDGNLREYLKNYFSKLKWKEKLEILRNIVDNLEFIHNRNYIHKDLHSGNVLKFNYHEWNDTKITDLGLAQSIHNSKFFNSTNFSGVLPYIAPEVLDGKQYTFASDIYSFGIIMTEISTGRPPYRNVPHDESLALAICNGLRPRIAKGTPECYIDLVNQCLDANPEKRPSAKKLDDTIGNWLYELDAEMVKKFIDKEEIISQETAIHSEAIYTSRFMSFTNLSKPKNSKGIQIEDPEVPDSQLIDLHISESFRLDRSHNF